MQYSEIWDISFLTKINDSTDIVRNNQTNQVMLRRETAAESFPVMLAISKIRHKNLMSIYDVRIIDGKCVTLCEFINGTTLEWNVERQLYDTETAKAIICQVCDGLTALHSNGIIHRDVKPSNVMIDQTGTVKIIDYDITRITNNGKNRDTTIMGTEGYAPPEQFGFSQTNAKSDVYSCGVLLNYLLTGHLPNEYLYQGEVTEVILECIEIDRGKRFDSAEELKLVLLGKKRSKLRPKRGLPGYRGGAALKVLTTILIVIWIFLVSVCARGLYTNYFEHPNLFWGQLVICSDVLIFWSALPYCFFGDIFTLSEKINRKNPQNGLFVMRSFGTGSIILGFVLLIMIILI